jgi:hypothetical protein
MPRSAAPSAFPQATISSTSGDMRGSEIASETEEAAKVKTSRPQDLKTYLLTLFSSSTSPWMVSSTGWDGSMNSMPERYITMS